MRPDRFSGDIRLKYVPPSVTAWRGTPRWKIGRILPAESVPVKVIVAPLIPSPVLVFKSPDSLASVNLKVRVVGVADEDDVVNPEDGGKEPEFGPAEQDSSSVI